MQLYMLTGFLGAGKTTALKHIIDYFADKKLAIIVNEFGKESIDGPLLKQDGVEMEEIINGSIFCACKIDKFEEVLTEITKKDLDVVLVETSGLSDTTSAYYVLTQPKFSALDYRGCITIVDALQFHKVVNTLKVCQSQVRMADLLVINKIDMVGEEQVDALVSTLSELNPYASIECVVKGAIKKSALDNLCPITKLENNEIKTQDLTLQKVLIQISPTCTMARLKSILRLLVEDAYRIKGFISVEGQTHLVECVGPIINISLYPNEEVDAQHLVILSGGKRNLLKKVKQVKQTYSTEILSIE
ncbi:hypothetical protein AN639_08790 [Candidatus Epulonipiscium fishelsonii]|uniref:Uncharacterized protein n=1 Tax=Candidatus Epulonipiscium fishelsonii TaxID=77094 RepID=A0ACC8XFP2_9FIRM|nr:hypothetical protein AN639_08790 [Epulopiscium sp. SCG-B05WGA-EpuloA1]ONI41947.1 hypothetical protein AN396_02600 [Epulopiscium sp. SCG-B11WGA-EpuloA1]